MTRKPTPRRPDAPPDLPADAPAAPTEADPDAAPPPGERLAKVIARAGRASRREAERLIAEGRVSVNGRKVASAALNVTGADRVTVDGADLAAPEPPRLWLYHKPAGLVTTAKDEKGRETVFDALPEGLPRVVSVGRLDLNSEGLLLLTNDGGIKRRLELPSTGWLRRYRVRVRGDPVDADLEPLRAGLVIEGERFQPMSVALDRQQGANAWLTLGLREGRNREIRRAMEAVGLVVNRLIRISYGPFQLGNLAAGAVEEVRPRVLRDQLGLGEGVPAETPRRKPAVPARSRRPAGPAGKDAKGAAGRRTSRAPEADADAPRGRTSKIAAPGGKKTQGVGPKGRNPGNDPKGRKPGNDPKGRKPGDGQKGRKPGAGPKGRGPGPGSKGR